MPKIPLQLAVVGAGPSAFYTASRVLSRLPDAHVHLFDRLWAPHGLVRYGVAPDHPEVKNCTHKFDELASNRRFRFLGNVSFSTVSNTPDSPSPPTAPTHFLSLTLSSLFSRYTHLLLAHGASQPIRAHGLDPRLTLPALSVVHWYTGHPLSLYLASSSQHLSIDDALLKTRHLTLIGHGNVSLDIARILLSSPASLKTLDIPENVLKVLSSVSETIEHIDIISRRGPREVAFTAKELREILNLEGVAMSPISDSLFQYRDGEKLTRQQSRIIDLLKKGSRTQFGTPHAKTWSLGFFRTPVSSSFDEQNNDSGRRGIVTFDLTRLDEQGRAVRAGKRETRTTDLVVTSLGYRSDVFASTPLAGSSTVSNVEAATSGTSDDGVAGWFDPILGRPRTLAPTSTPALLGSSSQPESPSPNRGRVYDAQARLVSNVYASGWAGTNGAKGVLASTMYDAYDVGDTIVADYLNDHSSDISTMISAPTQDVISPMMSSRAEQSEAEETAAGIPKWLDIRAREAGKRVVTYDDWRRIDAEEIRRGAEGGRGKHRERLLRWEDVEAFIASSDLS